MIDFFYSDPHFGHANVIEYSKRPFANVEEMDTELIERYNNRVTVRDTVLWLGDCFFCRSDRASHILTCLKGRKLLVRGNHDRSAGAMARLGFDVVADQMVLNIAGKKVVASHFPYAGISSPEELRESRKQLTDQFNRPLRHKDQILLHGHTHSKTQYYQGMVHVGVDAWDYQPASYFEVAELISSNE